jgi:hypothetical protein
MKSGIIFLISTIVLFTVQSVVAQAPAQSWVQRYTWPATNGYGGSLLKVDSNNNLIVVGNANGAGNPHIAVIKYSNSGAPIWTNYFTGAVSTNYDYPAFLAVDGSNNVVLGAQTWKNGSGNNRNNSYLVIEYSSGGAALWTNYFSASINSDDRLQSMTVDRDNNVIVTGVSGQAFNDAFATIKYSNLGVPLWTNVYTSANNKINSAYSIAVDTNKNVYVWGSTPGGVFANYALIKYSSDGLALWTNILSPSLAYYARGVGFNYLAVDSGNNIIAAGQSGQM